MSPFKRRRLREDLGSIDRPIWAGTTSMMQKLEAQLARLDIQDEEFTTATTTIADAHLNLEDRPFRFLALPAELRNSVYTIALEDYPTRLSAKGNLQTDCPLIHASKQVNSELKPLLVSDSPSLQTTVQGFDFDHVIAFFNDLSDIDFKHINRDIDSGDTTMEIHLTFDGRNPDCKNGLDTGKHTSWHAWLATTARGKAVVLRYTWKRKMNTECYYYNRVQSLRWREELKQKARLGHVTVGLILVPSSNSRLHVKHKAHGPIARLAAPSKLNRLPLQLPQLSDNTDTLQNLHLDHNMSLTKRKLGDGEHILFADMPNHKVQKIKDTQQSVTTRDDSSDKPFRFLDLAAELRNSIYSLALEDCPSRISTRSDIPQLQTECPLIRVSKQVNSELKSLLVTETTIKTIVHDFEFDHVIGFFDNLSEADFEDYIKSTDSSDRFLEVELKSTVSRWFSPGSERGHPIQAYEEWRDWISVLDRRFGLNVMYAWDDDEVSNLHESMILALIRGREQTRREMRWEKEKREGKKEH
ncbi:hypothetical protein PRZ48_000205 [Zasmidium cellare]|uniref:Uncharacterized protein n=1 Tax=Zasmidium cellare TaxID=395010 RepID=A0ABR0EZF5_ZASCE|nr:hypothetical protein PRZ48_000205 [Zasmidium cellare]